MSFSIRVFCNKLNLKILSRLFSDDFNPIRVIVNLKLLIFPIRLTTFQFPLPPSPFFVAIFLISFVSSPTSIYAILCVFNEI